MLNNVTSCNNFLKSVDHKINVQSKIRSCTCPIEGKQGIVRMFNVTGELECRSFMHYVDVCLHVLVCMYYTTGIREHTRTQNYVIHFVVETTAAAPITTLSPM